MFHELFPGIQWLSGVLLGPRPTVYCLELRTTKRVIADECIDIALAESRAMLNAPFDLVSWRAGMTRRWIPSLRDWVYVQDTESPAYLARKSQERELFGGVPRYEWVNLRAAELASSGAITVHESIELDYGYQGGIGVVGVLNYPDFSAANLRDFANEFIGSGYREMHGGLELSHPELGDPEVLQATQHSNGVCY